ncbi:MAG: DUF736 family protein [Alphaproteobacteria bacterium]|nr:DUF736 family protein [Alphaproteobacteria bacterium]
MAVIGTFIPAKDGGWIGRIRTLTINAKVRFVPNDNRENESSPAFRVFVGQSRIGSAWAAHSDGNPPKDYLRVRIDDPGLTGPLNAALFPDSEGLQARLVWKRQTNDV